MSRLINEMSYNVTTTSGADEDVKTNINNLERNISSGLIEYVQYYNW